MYKMLIVDDEKIERSGLCGLVRRFGHPFELFQAANGKQAVQLLQREQVQVLITDIRMPIMGGLELAAWVREHQPHVHVVIASAYGDFAYAQQAIGLKVCDYLLKPVEIEPFCTMMEHVLSLCHEDDKQAARKQEMEEYHRMKYEQLMWEILFPTPNKPLSEEALRFYKDTFGKNLIIPVLAETRGTFFDAHEASFERLLGQHCPWHFKLLIAEENQAVVLFYGMRPIPDDALEAGLRTVVERVRRTYCRELFCTVGSSAQGSDTMAESLREAEERSRYHFFMQSGTVFFCKDGYLSGSEVANAADALEQSILEDISYGAFEKAAQRLELLFKTLEQKHSLSELYVKNLFIQVLRRASKKAAVFQQNEELQQILNKIMGTASLHELCDYVKEQLRSMGAPAVGEERNTAAQRAVTEAIAIIRERYADPTLSMEEIAKRVYFSPGYFSSVFKGETGESAVHFLARYRLERARDLLENSNIRIADVGARVGFSSASYFVTVFRSAYGLSPSQYREQCGS